MAYDKIVDSKKLNADLTALADVIRSRTINQSKMSFPTDMIWGVYDIPKIDSDTAKSIIEIKSNMTEVGKSLFNNCKVLEKVDLPEAILIYPYAFNGCTKLTEVHINNAQHVDANAFSYCSALQTLSIENVTFFGDGAFTGCANLKSIVCSSLEYISANAFKSCASLKALVIPYYNNLSSDVCRLSSTNAFEKCNRFTGEVHYLYNPEGLKDGYIYVPDVLIDRYRKATNWSSFADRFKPLSEFDPTKI